MNDRYLRVLLSTMGVIAVAAGADGVLRGTDAALAKAPVTPDIDSEFRFFAAWYATAGLAMLEGARTDAGTARALRLSCFGLVGGAIGRFLSMKRFGRPSRFYRFLLAVEIALPAVLAVSRSRTATGNRKPTDVR